VAKVQDLLGHHDWNSSAYVSDWAERRDETKRELQEPFRLMRSLADLENSETTKNNRHLWIYPGHLGEKSFFL
jgi:hypothetical protein